MPFEAIFKGERVPPQEVPEKTPAECPECGDKMKIVKSHQRDLSGDDTTGVDSAFVPRHFWHPSRKGGGAAGGGGESCGESDEHTKMKSIAASKLKHIFNNNCWKVELEYRLKDTVTDADHRDADSLILFEDIDEQLGQGVAIEVQYKNKSKDILAVEKDYQHNNIAVVWATPDDFDDHNMRLNEADIRQRAKPAEWYRHLPDSRWQLLNKLENYPADEYINEVRHNLIPKAKFSVTLPPDVIDSLALDLWRKQNWADIIRGNSARQYIEDAARYDWSDCFEDARAGTETRVPFDVLLGEDRLRRWWRIGLSEADNNERLFYTHCPNCEKTVGPYNPTMTYCTRHCSCGTTFRIDIGRQEPGEILD